MLAAAAAELALIVYALVACLRTPSLRRKRAWIGVGSLGIDSTTRQLFVKVFDLQLFGAFLTKPGPYGRWIARRAVTRRLRRRAVRPGRRSRRATPRGMGRSPSGVRQPTLEE